MGCGSCGQKKQYNPIRTPVPQAPVPRVAPRTVPKPQIQVIPKAIPNQKTRGRFCEKCGWMAKTIRYTDPVTGVLKESKGCTNKRCPDYTTLKSATHD